MCCETPVTSLVWFLVGFSVYIGVKPTFHQELTGACYLPFYVDSLTAVVALVLGEHLCNGQCALVSNVTDLEVLKKKLSTLHDLNILFRKKQMHVVKIIHNLV